MYRVALAVLLALALLDFASACPRAPPRQIIDGGVVVTEHYCDEGKVLYMHMRVYRCFERHFQCPNGFWYENKCHCFPGTHSPQPGVCGQICTNCQNGWCSSSWKCNCNDGYQMVNGLCAASPSPSSPPPPPPPSSANYPPWWPPTNQYNNSQYPYWYTGPLGYPDPNTGSDPSKASNHTTQPQHNFLSPPWAYPQQGNHY